MNREIKFRAWDRVDKVMRVVTEISFRIDSIDVEPIEGTRECWELHDPVLFKGQFELMQYTGLKDKHGIEIYEGDILRSFNGTSDFPEKFVVIWSDFYKGFKPIMDDESAFNRSNCEVVGNIWETPESLKEDNR